MKTGFKLTTLAAILTGALLGYHNAQAVPIVYFGEDLNPGGTVPAGGNSETARNIFLSNLTGVGNEDFESIAAGTAAPLNLNFAGSSGSITATLTGQGGVCNGGSGNVGNLGCNGHGRYPTSGSNWFHTDSNGFTVSFSEAISAFGFYGTDIGDFSGQLTATTAGGAAVALDVPHTVGAPNGSLLFWGFIDTATSYTSITFSSINSVDVFGFDDLVIGDRGQISVPEPGTLALLGLGLAGLGWSKRKQQQFA